MIGEQPIVPLRGRYASKEMKALFPLNEAIDFRYQCSPEMRAVFSDKAKYGGWRENWVLLAQCEKDLGLNITDEQMAAIRAKKDTINFKAAEAYEKQLKHDVMAYLKEFADRVNEVCPGAGGVLHEGATSMCITDNQELAAMKAGLQILRDKAWRLQNASQVKTLEPTIQELNYRINSLRARGLKGATGTQASYFGLFNRDHKKTTQLDEMFSTRLGFPGSYTVTTQTYPRIVDYQILGSISILAYSLFCAADKLEQEKLRPYIMDIFNKTKQAAKMASDQWLERTLDDSSERRIIDFEPFYQMDYILEEMLVRPHTLSDKYPRVKLKGAQEEGLKLIAVKLANVVDKLYGFAEKYKNSVCTGYTHGQFAQPLTAGRRIATWDYNFVLALKDMENLIERGQEEISLPVLDFMINSRLNQVAIAAAKTALDIRLLQHDGEVNEPFGVSQVGSTAMFYKRNPMKCERINGLSRNKIGSVNELQLIDYDWLNTDAILELVLTVFSEDTNEQIGFTVHEKRARENLRKYMPFLASEDILLATTNAGGDRQELHEKARLASIEVQHNIDQGGENNMLELMAKAGFSIDLSKKEEHLNPETHIGRSREQIDEYFEKEVKPIREKYKNALGRAGKVQI